MQKFFFRLKCANSSIHQYHWYLESRCATTNTLFLVYTNGINFFFSFGFSLFCFCCSPFCVDSLVVGGNIFRFHRKLCTTRLNYRLQIAKNKTHAHTFNQFFVPRFFYCHLFREHTKCTSLLSCSLCCVCVCVHDHWFRWFISFKHFYYLCVCDWSFIIIDFVHQFPSKNLLNMLTMCMCIGLHSHSENWSSD